MQDDPLIVIATYSDATKAYIARGLLESEGIDASLRDEHLITANWMLSNAVGGVRLAVPQTQLERARRVLLQAARGELALDSEDQLLCPACGSSDVTEAKSGWRVAFAAFMFLNIPLPFTRTAMRCAKCGTQWRLSPDKGAEPVP